jgi:hypothetical protein
MPDNWVSGDSLTMEAQLEHERHVARRLREAYRLAETGRVDAVKALHELRAALEMLGLNWERACTEASAVYARELQEVLDEHAR